MTNLQKTVFIMVAASEYGFNGSVKVEPPHISKTN